MVPAQAGMIPIITIEMTEFDCGTRASGDDPTWGYNYLDNLVVVPAQAGMILTYFICLKVLAGGTRASGDDPNRRPSKITD